jgi:hypothetical protein
MIIKHASPISSEAVAPRVVFRETETRIAIGLGAVLLLIATLESEIRATALKAVGTTTPTCALERRFVWASAKIGEFDQHTGQCRQTN